MDFLRTLLTLPTIIFLSFNLSHGQENPFNKGVNITSWFQTSNAQNIQFSKYSKQDFVNIKTLGADVIRLPINMHGMTSGEPNYKVDSLLYYFLDQVVDWAEEVELNLILDNHSFDPAENTSNSIGEILIPVWRQLAEHYKDRSTKLYYEILNEPHGINDNVWNTIQQNTIDAIREIDSIHTIIVGPAGWNSYNNLKYMPEYSDTNLIYTFHFYDPFLFTHQGASWTDPTMVDLKDVPFPYEQSRMPDFPPSLAGTWIQSSFNNYSNDGSEQKIKQLIDIAVNFKAERNVNLFCGEFGVYIPNSNNEDRVAWYDIVRKYLEEKGISWTIWDYHGGFGLFEKGTDGLFEYDLNIPLVTALGFDEVAQKELVIVPDTANINIYDDFMGNAINGTWWLENGTVNFYSNENPADGLYCINWNGGNRYNTIGFDFSPNRDFTYLVSSKEMHFRCYIKANTPNLKFDIRFLDTKSDVPEDHPWRMGYTVDNQDIPFDNQWHLLDIPLQNFTEKGSYDNGWFNPIGAFDWSAIDKLEFVAEHSTFQDVILYIDKIELIDPNISSIDDNDLLKEYVLDQNYPNPFNPKTNIRFNLSEKSIVNLSVYNILGEKISELINRELEPGKYNKSFNGDKFSSGTYFYVLKANDFIETKKMILLK